jgi:hypothetical protein
MPRKTRKHNLKKRRSTLRRIPRKKGGAVPPLPKNFTHTAPTNSDNIMGGIAYNK